MSSFKGWKFIKSLKINLKALKISSIKFFPFLGIKLIETIA